jgi:transposase
METLSSHYARLLGLNDSWRVESVDLQIEDRRVEIRLSHVGSGVFCPECGEACGLADHADERRWRHLDTMQFTTELVARLPRSRCPEQGMKTIVPPWAGKHSRFTLLFKAFAIEDLKVAKVHPWPLATQKLRFSREVRSRHLFREVLQAVCPQPAKSRD